MEFETAAAAAAASELRASGPRSCTTCSKAKAKCVRAEGQVVCGRCSRLKKECHMKEPILRRRKIVKPTRAAQLEKLEHKIEHLVYALSSTSTSQRPSSGQQLTPPTTRNDTGTSRPSKVLNALCGCDKDCEPTMSTPTTGLSPTDTVHSQRGHVHQPPSSRELLGEPSENLFPGVSVAEAATLLDRYRRLMSHTLPFVILSPETTALQLYETKPLLLHAIVTVAFFHDLARQQLLLKSCMRDVAERILVNNEKNLGIIQAILVIVAWYHPHIFWGQQVTNLLHLAIAMSIDMNIDRVPASCGEGFKATTRPAQGQPAQIPSRVPTLEEFRTLSGIFYQTSMLASAFKKIDAMPWTAYLESCLERLEETRQYESDLFIVALCRIQHLIEESNRIDTPTAPMQMYVKAFTADLAKLRATDPCGDNAAGIIQLQLQYLTAEILIYELSLNDLQENHIGTTVQNISKSHSKPLHAHIADLYALLSTIKTFLAIFFSIPSDIYLTMPFSFFGQYAHAFIILTKLASLEIDGWDLKILNEEINFISTIDLSAEKFEATSRARIEGEEGVRVVNECFVAWSKKVRWMKSMFEAKISPEKEKGAEEDLGGVGVKEVEMRGVEVGDGAAMYHKSPQMYVEEQQQQQAMSGAMGVGGYENQQPTPPDDMLSGDFFNYGDWDFLQGFSMDMEFGWGGGEGMR